MIEDKYDSALDYFTVGSSKILDSIQQNMPPAVCGLFINNDKKILVVERNDGSYGLPGGKAEYGEKFIDALYRELEEEIGIKDDFSRLRVDDVPIIDAIDDDGFRVLTYKLWFIFRDYETIKLYEKFKYIDAYINEEGKRVKLMSIKEFMNQTTFPNYMWKLIEKVIL